ESTSRARELADYAIERFESWASDDARRRDVARAAMDSARALVAQLGGRPVTTTLCHGDVSAGNILVGPEGVGLIDFDDLRFDMPAMDLSQALLEIEEFSRAGSAVRLAGLERESTAAFREGYGRSFPEGPHFWLPHLRNLSVFVLTLARRRGGLGPGQVTTEFRYRWTIAELQRTIAASAVQRG